MRTNWWYGVLPWGIIMLGALHMAATFNMYDALTPAALWFFNGGIVLVFAGALNLINRRYGGGAKGVRWLCRVTNLVTLAFAVVSGIVGGASTLSMVVVIGLLTGISIGSFWPATGGMSNEG